MVRRLHPLLRLHFYSLPVCSISTSVVYDCNVKLCVLVRSGKIEAARHLFEEMPDRDVVSWNTMIAAYWRSKDFEESKRLFGLMPERNAVSWNSMISGCVDNGDIEAASRYFYKMPERNIASWNAMISGLVKYDLIDEAERLFKEMPRRNVISYTALVDGLACNGDIIRARRLFDRMPKKNIVSWAVMISGYVQNGMFDEARSLFNQMPEKNVVAITAMITGYCKEGKVENARKLFEEIHEKDLVSWNAMMSGYASNGHGEEALRLYIQMLQWGMKPDHSTLLVVLTACSVLVSLQCGRQIHTTALKVRLESNLSTCNAFIAMYSKCGGISDSDFIFREIQSPDIVSWNTIITASAQHDIVSRAGQLERACEVINAMPSDADGALWSALLGACRMHLNVELAELAARKLVELDSQNAGAYVMLSNIYAAAGMWKEVTKVRGLMKEQGVHKQPGYSWLEMGDKVHLFLGGDISHQDIKRIHSELETIYLHMMTKNDDKLLV